MIRENKRRVANALVEGSLTDIGAVNGIAEPSTNTGLLCCVYFHTYTIGKGMFRISSHSGIPILWQQPVLEKENSDCQTIEKATEKHCLSFPRGHGRMKSVETHNPLGWHYLE